MSQHPWLPAPVELLMRVPVPWVFVIAYLIGVGLQTLFPVTSSSTRLISISKTAGIVLFTIGAFAAAWSLLIFHKAQTTTTPGEISTELVTHGPYRISRNPMYLSLTLAYLGEAGILVQAWPLLTLPLVLTYVSSAVIPVEEARLRQAFGKEYERYCIRVRRWM